MTLFKQFRLKNNLTQQEMADNLKISLHKYRKYELGKKIPPYKILVEFLLLRGKKDDIKIASILHETINEGWYDKY